MDKPKMRVTVVLDTEEMSELSKLFPVPARGALHSAKVKLRRAMLTALLDKRYTAPCTECGSKENEILSTGICAKCF